MDENLIECDASEWKERITPSEERLSLAARIACLGIWDYRIDTGERIWSSVLREIFGLPKDYEADPALIRKRIHPSDSSSFDEVIEFKRQLGTIHSKSRTLRYNRAGEIACRWATVDVAKFPREDSAQHRVLVVVRDVTREKSVDDRLQHTATHDGLTGLPARSSFARRLDQEVRCSSR